MQNSLLDIIYIFWFYFHRCGEKESAFYFPLFKNVVNNNEEVSVKLVF